MLGCLVIAVPMSVVYLFKFKEFLIMKINTSFFAFFLCLTDIKRLAEKEDWVVDNEGLTSLVGKLVCCSHFLWSILLFLNRRNETVLYVLQKIESLDLVHIGICIYQDLKTQEVQKSTFFVEQLLCSLSVHTSPNTKLFLFLFQNVYLCFFNCYVWNNFNIMW